MAVTDEWTGEGRPFVAATAHKGLTELDAIPAQTLDASAPSETAFSGVMSEHSSTSAKATYPVVTLYLNSMPSLCIAWLFLTSHSS